MYDFYIIPFCHLSFVLKHFNHILVATHKLAASVQHSGVRETAFVTYMFYIHYHGAKIVKSGIENELLLAFLFYF